MAGEVEAAKNIAGQVGSFLSTAFSYLKVGTAWLREFVTSIFPDNVNIVLFLIAVLAMYPIWKRVYTPTKGYIQWGIWSLIFYAVLKFV